MLCLFKYLLELSSNFSTLAGLLRSILHRTSRSMIARFIIGSFSGVFFGSVFVRVFGLLLDAFWEPFWLRSELLLHVVS